MTETGTFLPPMLAHEWDGQPHVGWTMSEKLDGVRAVWNGLKLTTRANTDIRAPKEWVDGIRAAVGGMRIDGELFIAPRRFEDTMSIVRGPNETNGRWKEIRFMVFDVIADGPHAARMAPLIALRDAGRLPPFIEIVPQIPVNSPGDVREFLNAVLLKGGEGVMLRNPATPYEHRRTRALQKVKMFYDAEGTVIGFVPGKGKFAGMPGAVLLDVGGQVVRVGSGMDERQRRGARLGDVITFRFTERTKQGAYRFPVFVRFRHEQI